MRRELWLSWRFRIDRYTCGHRSIDISRESWLEDGRSTGLEAWKGQGARFSTMALALFHEHLLRLDHNHSSWIDRDTLIFVINYALLADIFPLFSHNPQDTLLP